MSKKKTHAEYVAELAKVNPDIEVIGIYCGASIKIPHRCKKDGYVWDATPNNILRGRGCPNCETGKRAIRRRKTHAEYVKEVELKNPNVEVIGIYRGNKIKIPHKCRIDGYVWDVAPNNILQGNGCPACYGNKKNTHEEYVAKLAKINPDIEVIGTYCNNSTKIPHRCKIDGNIWSLSPNNALQGKGCPVCKGTKTSERQMDSREDYISKLAIKNPNIELIGAYNGSKNKTMHHCLIHDIYWEIAPMNAMSGHGCEECRLEKIYNACVKTHEQYVEEVKNINPNVKVIGTYTNARNSIKHYCLLHNIYWDARPYRILEGCGCNVCKMEKIKDAITKTHEQYLEELHNTNPDIIVIGTYVNANTPILHHCLIDGNEWFARPATMLQGGGCPVCSESKGERKVRLWLEKNNIKYIYQYKYEDCKDINILPFDFYLPTYNILIEYDGEQHFRPIEYFGGQEKFELQQKHDKIKNEYCKNNGIPLLRIPYFKYDNIEEELNNFLFI